MAEVQLGNAQVGTHKRLDGVYLDDVQRREAEVRRAEVEGREPDLDNPPAIAGTVLVPVALLPDTSMRAGHSDEPNEDFITVEVPDEEPVEPDTTKDEQDAVEKALNDEHKKRTAKKSAAKPESK